MAGIEQTPIKQALATNGVNNGLKPKCFILIPGIKRLCENYGF